jgi:hypothetical protein
MTLTDGDVATRTHTHHAPGPTTTHVPSFRLRLDDIRLALWVVGLLALIYGIAGLFSAASDYDAGPGAETWPSIAVLAGGGLVVVAALMTLVSAVRRIRRR